MICAGNLNRGDGYCGYYTLGKKMFLESHHHQMLKLQLRSVFTVQYTGT